MAHPPYPLWGTFAFLNYRRWGGEHNRPGNDGGCFASALESVRRFGGVLEHPAKTRAWRAHGLIDPVAIGWQLTIDGGWVCEVWQSAYGHRASKATWLYYVGENPPFALRWERSVTNKPALRKRETNAIPVAFRDELLRLAILARGCSN